MTTEQKAVTTPDGEVKAKRDRRTADQVKSDHFQEYLAELGFAGKVSLIKELKNQVNIELENRRKAASEADALATDL